MISGDEIVEHLKQLPNGNASYMCEDDYSLGREVMKIYNGFAMAMNKEIHGDIR